MDRLELAHQLHNDDARHYNCAQAVLCAYAGECGLELEEAYRLGQNFGAGMRHGGTCGAVTGALMVLGLLGKSTGETQRLLSGFREKNEYLDCASLLKKAHEADIERKEHCDARVLDAVGLVEEILKEK